MVKVYCKNDDSINSKKSDAILALYVDDLMLAEDDKAVLKMLKEKLMSHFATMDMGDISLIFGTQVTRNCERDTHHLSGRLHQVRTRKVRDGGVQTREHARSRKRTVSQPARRESS